MKKVISGEKHFCASVWILSKETPRQIVLVYHKKLRRWLQPGGHIERHENPVQTAIREVFEETGVDIGFLSKKVRVIDEEGSFLPVPEFLMEQTIPAHKDVPLHYHIDINYVVEIEKQELKLNNYESSEIGWFAKKEALKLPIHEDTRVVLSKILD